MKSLKKSFTLMLLGFIFVTMSGVAFALPNLSQGFDGAGTWTYTTNPLSYNVSGDTWDIVPDLNGGAITPHAGGNFWGIRDLDNPNGGGAFTHSIDFATVDTSADGESCISFFYYVDGFESSDTLTFSADYTYPGGSGSVMGEPVATGTSGGWVEYQITVDMDITSIDFSLEAAQNGGSDYGGYDSVTFTNGACTTPDYTIEPPGPTTMYIQQLWSDTCDPDDDAELAVVCNSGMDPVDMHSWGVGETGTTMSVADTMFIGATLDELNGDCDDGVGAVGSCIVAPGECVILGSNPEERADDQWGPAYGITEAPGAPTSCNGTAPAPLDGYRFFDFGQPGPSTGGWFDARYNNNGDAMGLFSPDGTPVACVSYGDGNLSFPDATPAACADIFSGGAGTGQLPVPVEQSIDTIVENNGVGEDYAYYVYDETSFVEGIFNVCQLDLAIDKNVSPTNPAPGDTVTYTISISNTTNIPADALNGGGADITDTFDANFTNVSCDTGTVTGNMLTVTDLTIPAMSVVDITCTATVLDVPDGGCMIVGQDISNTADWAYMYPDFAHNNDAPATCPLVEAIGSASADQITIADSAACALAVNMSMAETTASDQASTAPVSALVVASMLAIASLGAVGLVRGNSSELRN